jgi:2-oxoisovalerate dehydrogenase E2 component (dihydrolipoyl transacylase)
MSLALFNLPDVGEGLTEAEIVSWKVAPGDKVSVNQVICEIETAKSIVELPCPFSGTVEELLAKEGDTVEVGKPIISVQAEGSILVAGPITSSIPIVPESSSTHQAVADVAATVASDENKPNLVGYGSSAHGGTRRKRAGGIHTPAVVPTATSSISVPVSPVAAASASTDVIAKPPIRKLAKDLNVDLSKVQATGLAGEITRDDVVGAASQASVFRNLTTPAAPSEREERIPVKGVRKAIATAMVQSAFTAPHVSIFVDVDATRTMEYVKRLKASTDFAGVKVTLC